MYQVWRRNKRTGVETIVERFRSDIDAAVYAALRNYLDGASAFFYVV